MNSSLSDTPYLSKYSFRNFPVASACSTPSGVRGGSDSFEYLTLALGAQSARSPCLIIKMKSLLD